VTRGKIAGVPVDISRTGYTGDLDLRFDAVERRVARLGQIGK